MKLFISWSGERSRAVATSLREWLPLVLHYAQPWLSDRDIAAGERWAVEIGRELEGTQFGLIVLTSDNLSAPWILFEAGALSKAFSASNVCPYLIDIEFKDVSGPLSQFQGKKSDKSSTFELLEAINAKSDSPVEQARLTALFDALWPQLEMQLKSVPAAKPVEAKARTQAQVLEELVVATRRMEARLDRLVASSRVIGEAPTIEVELLTPVSNPELKDVGKFVFTPEQDVVEEIGRIVGFDPESYGAEWVLKRGISGRPVSRREGPYFAKRAGRGAIRLKLEAASADQPGRGPQPTSVPSDPTG